MDIGIEMTKARKHKRLLMFFSRLLRQPELKASLCQPRQSDRRGFMTLRIRGEEKIVRA